MQDYRASKREIGYGLVRNEYGGGTREEQLQIRIDGGERKNLDIDVLEKMYEKDEVTALFERCIKKLEQEMLGDNKSMDHVENDLILISHLQDEPVEISWKLDNYEVMNIYGQLKEENLVEEGTIVNLEAVITYTENQELQTKYQCAVMVYPKTLNKEEEILHKIKNLVNQENNEARMESDLQLPELVDGARIEYFYRMDSRGIVLLVMAAVIGILFYIQEIQKRERTGEYKKADDDGLSGNHQQTYTISWCRNEHEAGLSKDCARL